MKPNDRVVLTSDPLRHGYGRLIEVLSDGRVTVQWESGDIRPYHPQDLEHAERWERRVEGAVTDALLDRLARPD